MTHYLVVGLFFIWLRQLFKDKIELLPEIENVIVAKVIGLCLFPVII